VPCRLLVNLVTSVTLGLALAAEPAEPTVMERPPRRPNKRLLGKLILWRCFFVCHLVVVLVLGMFEWALKTGRSLGQGRAEAFNVLVGAQVVYFITCRWVEGGAPRRCPTQQKQIISCCVWGGSLEA
jgi:magnesium-transporting ATPase (P-type)